jgi:hypothetical protein
MKVQTQDQAQLVLQLMKEQTQDQVPNQLTLVMLVLLLIIPEDQHLTKLTLDHLLITLLLELRLVLQLMKVQTQDQLRSLTLGLLTLHPDQVVMGLRKLATVDQLDHFVLKANLVLKSQDKYL